MKKLVLYYSYTGHTKAIAEELAAKESADITEIKDVRRPGKLRAYTAGCLAAIRGKAWAIQPLDLDWAAYDHVILLSPIWAGNSSPAFNAALKQLPESKTAAVIMVSAGGKSNCRERLETVLKEKGCALESFEDIKA